MGGDDQGEWRAVSNGFLLPVRVVMAVFRGKLLAALDTAVHEGSLTLPDGMTLWHWATLRNKLGRQKWNVHIRERYPHGAGSSPIWPARSVEGSSPTSGWSRVSTE